MMNRFMILKDKSGKIIMTPIIGGVESLESYGYTLISKVNKPYNAHFVQKIESYYSK